MTEIKLELAKPELFIQQLRHAAHHWSDGGSAPIPDALLAAAAQIEEQVKPAIEEPIEWGSVVQARRVGYGAEDTTVLRWQRQNTHDANDSWVSEPAGDLGVRYSSHWTYLTEVEVLRVGLDTP